MSNETIRHPLAAASGYRLVCVISALLILLGCVIGILVPAGLGWDFANFYDAGRVVAAGELDLLLKGEKGLIDGAPPQGKLDFWGTPLSAYLYAPLSWFGPEAALILFKIENTLAYGLALIILYCHLRQFADGDEKAQWQFAALYAGLALLYQPFWTVFRVGGQTTATAFLLLCVALVAHSRLRFGWSSFLFVVAVMIKPALATALLFLMVFSGRRFALLALFQLAVFGLVSVATMGWDIQMEFVSKMLTGASRNARWYYNSSLYVFVGELQHWTSHRETSAFAQTLIGVLPPVIKIGVTATLTFFWVTSRDRFHSERAKAHFTFLLALLFFLLVSQTLWEHYLAFLFIPLMFLVASSRHLDQAARWMVGAIVFCLPLQNLIVIQTLQSWLAFDTPATLSVILALKTAPLWLSWILIWRYHGVLVRTYAL